MHLQDEVELKFSTLLTESDAKRLVNTSRILKLFGAKNVVPASAKRRLIS